MIIRQLLSFSGIGAIATFLQYAILLALTERNLQDPVVASAIGFSISAVFNYLGNYFITFRSRESHPIALLKFLVVAITGLALNTIGMEFLVHFLSFQYLLSQIVCTGVVFSWNFLLNRRWTFKPRSKNPSFSSF